MASPKSVKADKYVLVTSQKLIKSVISAVVTQGFTRGIGDTLEMKLINFAFLQPGNAECGCVTICRNLHRSDGHGFEIHFG